MKRLGWLLVAVMTVGCGSVPNSIATQTRTSEIVDMTVAARLPPTAVPAPTATDLPVANTPAAPAPSVPQPTPRYSQISLMNGSWVAYSPEIAVRFFAPPSVQELAGHTYRPNEFLLRSPSVYGDYELIDVYRFRDKTTGGAPGTWRVENDGFLTAIDAHDYSVTFGPSPQRIGEYLGQRGQFNFAQSSNGLRVSGTMWVGQVGSDIIVIVYLSEPDREWWADRGMTQIMDTIDFNAR